MKKKIDRKEVRKQVVDLLAEGTSKKDILKNLSKEYHDKRSLSLIIASTPSTEDREKYGSLNNFLLIVAILSVGYHIYYAVYIILRAGFADGAESLVPILIGGSLIPAIASFNGSQYKNMSFIYMLFILISMVRVSMESDSNIYLMLQFGLGFAVLVLCQYIGSKAFPNFQMIGYKKEADGTYPLGKS